MSGPGLLDVLRHSYSHGRTSKLCNGSIRSYCNEHLGFPSGKESSSYIAPKHGITNLARLNSDFYCHSHPQPSREVPNSDCILTDEMYLIILQTKNRVTFCPIFRGIMNGGSMPIPQAPAACIYPFLHGHRNLNAKQTDVRNICMSIDRRERH